jgi:uncharacterized membrane protein
MKKTFLLIGTVVLVIIASCKKDKTPAPATSTTAAKSTYNADVKSIMNAKCATSGCHAASAQFPDLSTYSATKSNITIVLERMNRGVGTSGFMPDGGSKTQADIDKITKWQTDGLLEN